MKLAIAALAMVHMAAATAVQAQPGSSSEASIPAQFHGRWAETQRACRPQHFTSVITIDRRGWSSFEQGGRIVRAGQVRRGTHYFRVKNYAGGDETSGSLALRRDGARIVMTFKDDNDRPVHHSLVRCR